MVNATIQSNTIKSRYYKIKDETWHNLFTTKIESGEFITKEWLIGLQYDPWIEIEHSDYRGLEIGLCE